MKPRYRISLLVAFCALLAFTGNASAQITTGGLKGLVTDKKSNQPLIGVSVVATETTTGSKYGALTDIDGYYTIRNMKVGRYNVRFTYVGYQPEAVNNVPVQLGEIIPLNSALGEQASTTEEVVVTADRSTVTDRSKTGPGISVPESQIKNLPTISRDFSDFARLSPNAGSGSSLGGRNNRFNNISIDGAVNNDVFGLAASGTPGGQASTTPISLDAIQEFQVLIAPFDVRQGGFTGGGINAITRSGTNDYTGSIFTYGRNQGIIGFSPDALRAPSRPFSEGRVGFRFGGPLIRDQLFFFINGEFTGRSSPRNFFIGGDGNSRFGGDNAIVGALPDSAARFERALGQLGFSPGSSGPLDIGRGSRQLFGRLDWNISPEHKLTLRHNFVDAGDDNISNSLTQFQYPSSLYIFRNTTNSTVLQLNSTFGGKFFNELLVNFQIIRDRRDVRGSTFPTVITNVLNATGANSGLQLYAGTENNSAFNKLDQNIIEITDNFTTYLGAHTLTLGTHNEFISFSNGFVPNFYGNYTIAGVGRLEAIAALPASQRGNLPVALRPANLLLTYARPGFPDVPLDEFSVAQLGFYAQDEWAVTPNFNLTAGVRIDIPIFGAAPFANRLVDSTFNQNTSPLLTADVRALNIRTDVTANQLLFSPRLGFNFDIQGDKQSILRGGVGVFTGRTPYVWISNNYGNTGVNRIATTINSPAFFFTTREEILAALGNPQSNPNTPPQPGVINVIDRNFRFPQVLRGTLSFDQKLPAGFVATLEGLYTRSLNDPAYRDLNLRVDSAGLGRFVSPLDGRPLFGTPAPNGNLQDRINTRDFTGVIYIGNTNENYQYSVTALIERRFTTGSSGLDALTGSIAYTHSRAFDVNSLTSSVALSNFQFNLVPGNPNTPPVATSNFEVRNRLVATLNYDIRWNEMFTTNLSLFYVGNEGLPFSHVYNGDVNGDGRTSNDLIYVPRDASAAQMRIGSLNAGVFVPNQAQADAFNRYLERVGLGEFRGQVLQRNSLRTPWENRVDFRLTQGISFVSGQNLEITLDILNVLNLLSNEWGRTFFVANQSLPILNLAGVETATRLPVFTFTRNPDLDPWIPSDLGSRWSAQIGVRYTF